MKPFVPKSTPFVVPCPVSSTDVRNILQWLQDGPGVLDEDQRRLEDLYDEMEYIQSLVDAIQTQDQPMVEEKYRLEEEANEAFAARVGETYPPPSA